jgi:hypothetical protein
LFGKEEVKLLEGKERIMKERIMKERIMQERIMKERKG